NVLARKEKFDVPSERCNPACEIGNLAELDRHATLVVRVEPDPPHASGVEASELALVNVHGYGNDATRAVWPFGIESRHAVENRRIVGAVNGWLGEHHAVDSEGAMQPLEISKRRFGRIVAPVGRKPVTPFEHMDMRVDRSTR